MFKGDVPHIGIAITLFVTILLTFLVTLYLLKSAPLQSSQLLTIDMGPQTAQANIHLVTPPNKQQQPQQGVAPHG